MQMARKRFAKAPYVITLAPSIWYAPGHVKPNQSLLKVVTITQRGLSIGHAASAALMRSLRLTYVLRKDAECVKIRTLNLKIS